MLVFAPKWGIGCLPRFTVAVFSVVFCDTSSICEPGLYEIESFLMELCYHSKSINFRFSSFSQMLKYESRACGF